MAEAKSYYVRGTNTSYRPPDRDDEYYRRVRAEKYQEELSRLGGGASLADIQAAGERADRSMAEEGMATSREIQARENLKDTPQWLRSTMPLAVSTYKPFGWLVDQLPGESVTKGTRQRGEDILSEISAAGENRTAELLGGIGGALLDPVTYTGYGALTKLGAGARSIAAARGLARPTAGLGGRVAGEAALGVAVETPIAYARGDEDPLLSGALGGVAGGAMPLLGKAWRGATGAPDPYARNLPENMTRGEQEAAAAGVARSAELESRLSARKVIAELTEAADDAARRGDVAEASKIRERAARQVEQDEALGKMGVELYGVRKAASEQAELLDKARDIDVDVPSTQVDKFQKRAAKTAQLRGEVVPETPAVRPEVEADVAARQVDDQIREEALKDPDIVEELEHLEMMGMPREQAEAMVVFGDSPKVDARGYSSVGSNDVIGSRGQELRPNEVPGAAGQGRGGGTAAQDKPFNMTQSDFVASGKGSAGDHGDLVMDAMRRGEPVSDLVLSDYPGTAKYYGRLSAFDKRTPPYKTGQPVNVKLFRGGADSGSSGQFYSDDPRIAGEYGKVSEHNKSFSNPKVIDDRGGKAPISTKMIDDATKEGHDALIVVNMHDPVGGFQNQFIDLAAKTPGASGDQLTLGLQSGLGSPQMLDDMVTAAVKAGKFAKPHVIAGARWAMQTAGDAIRSMRDFAQVMIQKFGRGIRKHVPEMWQKFKAMQARQADFRRRTQTRRSRGAVDLRGRRDASFPATTSDPLVVAGETSFDTLSRLADSPDAGNYAKIAREVLDNVTPDSPLHQMKTTITREGSNVPVSKSGMALGVRISKGDLSNPKTVLHELMHAATIDAVARDFSTTLLTAGKGGGYIDSIRILADDGGYRGSKIARVYLDYLDDAGLMDKMTRGGSGFPAMGNATRLDRARKTAGVAYGDVNLLEFIAEAFSNPLFQKKLASIKSRSGQSLWSRMVAAVRSAMGLEGSGRVLDDAVDEVLSLVRGGEVRSGGRQTAVTSTWAESGPHKDPAAGVSKTARQKEIAFAEQREGLRKSAREYVKGKIDPSSPRGLQLTEQANTVRTEKSLASFQRKVDSVATGREQRESIKQATEAGRSLSKFDKTSGINMRGVASDSDFAGAMDNLRTLGVANPLNPTKQELAEMGAEGRMNFMEAVEQVKKSYIHSRKYGKRPHAEGANPLEGERGFVNEGWGRGVRRLFQLGGEALDTAIDPVADRVRRYSPRLLGRLRTYTSDHLMERHRYRERIDPLMKSANSALKKFPKDAKIRLTSALSRGDKDEVMRIADAMGEGGDTVRALWAESRVVLDELYKKAREAGIDVGFLENYWPRLVKRGRADDLATFFTKKPTNDMTRALSVYAKREGISVDAIPPAKRREIVDSVTRGHGPRAVDGGRPGQMKHRTIGDIPDEAQHFYESYDAAMDVYIDRITEAIARKKMFGADVPLNASEGDPFGMGGSSKIDTTDDLNASIGAILDSDGVPPEKVGETLEVIRTLFNSASTSVGPVTANLRAFGYMATMGQLKSALAQLEDIASTAVFMPREIPNMARAFTRSVLGKTEASTIRIGADRVAEEFAGQRGAERAVNLLFKTTGLSKIDRVIKNTTLESALIGGQKAARKPGSKAYNRLMKESEEMWGKEGAEKLIKDLADGNFSDEVATHLHSKLADIQPLTSLDVPLGYHYMKQVGGKSAWAGAPVLTYQLKTFFLRRMGALRREGLTGMARGAMMIKNGEKAEGTKLLLRSTRNLTAMATVLTAAGATRQQAVGYLYGNENDVSYDVTDAMLSLTGLNRYSTQQLQRGGADFYSSVFAPPSATTALDVITDGFRMADGKMPRTLKRVPHIQTLDIFSRGGFSDYMRGGSKPPEEETED